MGKKFNRRALQQNNQRELDRITNWLSSGPKVCLQAAVTRAHSEVMQSEHIGGQMMHDSSNAAYNWRISLDGSIPSQLSHKGKDPVGEEGDQRTRTAKTSDIIKTILKRLSDDANQFDRAIWGAASISKVSLVNPIGGYYAINAQLDDAVAGRHWRPQVEMAVQSAFDAWYSGGPEVNWRRHAKTTFGGGTYG